MQFQVAIRKLSGFGLWNLKYMVVRVAAVIFLRGLILCADISWQVFTTYMNPWLMFAGEQHLGFILEIQCMLDTFTSVIMQALESSLKKVKAYIPTQETSYPVYSDGSKGKKKLPFSREV
jgi:hypothetical protein